MTSHLKNFYIVEDAQEGLVTEMRTSFSDENGHKIYMIQTSGRIGSPKTHRRVARDEFYTIPEGMITSPM